MSREAQSAAVRPPNAMRFAMACLFTAVAANPLQRFATDIVAPKFFAWFASSEGMAKLHQEHVDSPIVRHMIKGSVLASAPDDAKLDFARSSAGAAVADFMRLEQQHIGQWKIERIVEAAGPSFDAPSARAQLMSEGISSKVVVYSFVDCPWCLLAKERLMAVAQADSVPWLTTDDVSVIELEDLGQDGKSLRAALALTTGRTSMPSVWLNGRCVGGWTDGDMPAGEVGLCLDASPGFEELSDGNRMRELLS